MATLVIKMYHVSRFGHGGLDQLTLLMQSKSEDLLLSTYTETCCCGCANRHTKDPTNKAA